MRSRATRLGIARNTVVKAVSVGGPLTDVRAPQDSGISRWNPRSALLRENSRTPTAVLAERVGWSGSPAWFQENEAGIRPEYAPGSRGPDQ